MSDPSPQAARSPQETAHTLMEALPYIRRFQGKTIVIKYGGNAMVDLELKKSFSQDVILLKLAGIHPVIVHGGGPQISDVLNRLGKASTFVNGLRVTDKETMDVVEMVLGGLINKEIVSLINAMDGRAVGLTGKDGYLIRARKLPFQADRSENGNARITDYGQVGEVQSIDPQLIRLLESQGFIPVIAPIGVGPDGTAYNINSDMVAGKLAAVLQAEKLMMLTNTPGVLDKQGNLVADLSVADIPSLEQDGTISQGMIPKVSSAVDAVQSGVDSSLIIDGRVRHALILELFTDAGIGTRIRS